MGPALALARRGLGRVWPNPAVGCVLVREGRIIGRGWTGVGGRPHAETEALRRAVASGGARGATAYVTLEPCSHAGKTPPCAKALIESGIGRAVIAARDPDPRVDGRGTATLEEAGIAVTVGVRGAEARALNAGFFSRIERGRPVVTLKLATTLDGRIATHTGASRWISGPVARDWTHALRASHDAIMVGSGTALADDPELTCRLPGMADHSPVRVVVDRRLRLPLTSRLVRDAGRQATWLITLAENGGPRLDAYRECGVEVIEVGAEGTGNVDLEAGLRMLGGRGITRLLVEGGSHLAAALVGGGLVDRLEWFRAATLMGGDGVPALQAYGVDAVDQQVRFARIDVRSAGEDLWESYVRAE
ncbi:MAG: bifunctional diaminohydroxyphosphoribosylaminopyrimidine deaminase/5-amino-6-(5-phosphoribosylamino)uracil reductase RibD [Inquilinus sp.]|nr:bifunctional diaminohydroxyphosphoribosylaminopyrimidine deaminase/5-amino-6-(5-phosphoribosylamino)uracil reductase RibD [Inquilinus sp.]